MQTRTTSGCNLSRPRTHSKPRRPPERTLNLAVQESLGPSAIDYGMKVDTRVNGEMQDEEEVADEYRGVDVGGGEDQFAL